MFGFAFEGSPFLLSRSRIILQPVKSGIGILHTIINELVQSLIVTDVPGEVEDGPLDDSDSTQRAQLGLDFFNQAVLGL